MAVPPLMPVRLRNRSPSPQLRWTWFMVPATALLRANIPAKPGIVGIVKPEGWLWQLGERRGELVRVWVRADLQGGEAHAIDLTAFVVVEDAVHMAPPTRFDWLLDKPQDAVLRLRVNGNEVPLLFDRVEEAGPLVSVFRFRVQAAGFRAVAYAVVPVGQDVFDLQGHVTWCGADHPDLYSISAQLELVHGETHAAYHTAQMAQTPFAGGQTLLAASQGELPEGFSVPFYGALIAEPDTATDALEPDKLRLAAAQAARGGPILALAGSMCWQGEIGPHHAYIPPRALDACAATPPTIAPPLGSPWAARQWATPPDSGRTGDQGVFGRIKGLRLFADRDPLELETLRIGACDQFYRAHHMLDEHGEPLGWDLNDGARRTYHTSPFYRIAGKAWGKANDGYPPFGYDHERGPLEQQHRGNLYPPVAAAILGDWIMADELDALLAIECRDTRHGGQGDGSLEAPRASGRMLQEWAWWWWSASPVQRERLQWLADRMERIVSSQPTWNVSGPVRVTQALDRHYDKNPLRDNTDANNGREAWIPWQESFVVDGMIAWAAIWQRLGDQGRMARFLAHAVTLANVVVDHGIIEHPTIGPIVVTYAQWNADGAANGANYLTVPRPMAKTDLSGDADMIYGGIALNWYSGAILTAAKAGNGKANRLRTVLYETARNESDWEWIVGDQ